MADLIDPQPMGNQAIPPPDGDTIPGVAPVGPERTVEQLLARAMRRSIVGGVLKPGARLRYRDLARQFNVSVTPVRIAVRELANNGLVEIRPHGGAYVAPLSREEVELLYVSRIALEGWLARLGAPNLTDDHLAHMASILAGIDRRMGNHHDREEFLEAAWAFRSICYQAAERPAILEAVTLLFERSARYNYLTVRPEFRLKESLNGAHVFLIACQDRDGARACAAISEALQRTLDYLLNAFVNGPDEHE